MLKVGLTGGIASGKTTVAHLFTELGITVIDADVIAHQVTRKGEPAFNSIVEYFGKSITKVNGEIDRRKLRKQVFDNPKQRLWLEGLLHPIILEQMQVETQQASSPYVILVIPLMKEVNCDYLVDHVIVVDTSLENQIARASARDGDDRRQIEAITATQSERDARLAIADDIIDNNQDLAHLKQQVQALHAHFMSNS